MHTGRIRYAQDFGRVLRSPVVKRSVHFAVHYAPERPGVSDSRESRGSESAELSTDADAFCTEPVDDWPPRCRLAVLVPKRHARRSVTRSLLKRQIRAAVQRLGVRLAPGLWLVRLRAGFGTSHFRSAGSQALRVAARQELDELLSRCGDRTCAQRGEAGAPAARPARPESADLPPPAHRLRAD